MSIRLLPLTRRITDKVQANWAEGKLPKDQQKVTRPDATATPNALVRLKRLLGFHWPQENIVPITPKNDDFRIQGTFVF